MMTGMHSRRRFLSGALAMGLAMNVKAQARREIVDAQVHLWKASAPDLPWVPGAKPQMPEPFTIEKAVPLMDEAGVDRVVIVTPALLGHNNSYSLEAARRYPTRFAVMGRVDQKNPKAAALFPKWREQPGMLGVRVSFLGPTATQLTDGSTDWIWPAAEKAGLPIMFLTTMQASVFGPIAEHHPGLQLIVDYLGVSGDA